jgi:hypothetical protein
MLGFETLLFSSLFSLGFEDKTCKSRFNYRLSAGECQGKIQQKVAVRGGNLWGFSYKTAGERVLLRVFDKGYRRAN